MASAHTPDAVLHFECMCMQTNGGGVARTAGRDERRFCASQRDAVFLSSHPFCLPQVITALFRGWNECTAST